MKIYSYNPSKITINGKCNILTTSGGILVFKEKNKDILSLYRYLDSRSFNRFPKILDVVDNKYVYEYLFDSDIPINQKMIDEAGVLSELHYKTCFFKKVMVDKFKEIYDGILGNINYVDEFYSDLYNRALSEEYVRPSLYILLINYSLIKSNIRFLRSELDRWYRMVESLDKIRVVYNHNNLSIDHFIDNKFISWDNYIVDSPVIDLINIYRNDYGKYDFSLFLEEYLKNFELLDYERCLLFINISIPSIVSLNGCEIDNTIEVSKLIDYIHSTNDLIRPYYSKE